MNPMRGSLPQLSVCLRKEEVPHILIPEMIDYESPRDDDLQTINIHMSKSFLDIIPPNSKGLVLHGLVDVVKRGTRDPYHNITPEFFQGLFAELLPPDKKMPPEEELRTVGLLPSLPLFKNYKPIERTSTDPSCGSCWGDTEPPKEYDNYGYCRLQCYTQLWHIRIYVCECARSVSLLVVATVKDLIIEFAAVSIKLGGCLAWLSAGISGSLALTATLTCLGSSR